MSCVCVGEMGRECVCACEEGGKDSVCVRLEGGGRE